MGAGRRSAGRGCEAFCRSAGPGHGAGVGRRPRRGLGARARPQCGVGERALPRHAGRAPGAPGSLLRAGGWGPGLMAQSRAPYGGAVAERRPRLQAHCRWAAWGTASRRAGCRGAAWVVAHPPAVLGAGSWSGSVPCRGPDPCGGAAAERRPRLRAHCRWAAWGTASRRAGRRGAAWVPGPAGSAWCGVCGAAERRTLARGAHRAPCRALACGAGRTLSPPHPHGANPRRRSHPQSGGPTRGAGPRRSRTPGRRNPPGGPHPQPAATQRSEPAERPVSS